MTCALVRGHLSLSRIVPRKHFAPCVKCARNRLQGSAQPPSCYRQMVSVHSPHTYEVSPCLSCHTTPVPPFASLHLSLLLHCPHSRKPLSHPDKICMLQHE